MNPRHRETLVAKAKVSFMYCEWHWRDLLILSKDRSGLSSGVRRHLSLAAKLNRIHGSKASNFKSRLCCSRSKMSLDHSRHHKKGSVHGPVDIV